MSQCLYNTLCLLGLALSSYSLYVEYKIQENSNYVPICNFKTDDIVSSVFGKASTLGESLSQHLPSVGVEGNCKDTFTSDYGRGVFGFIDGSKFDLAAKIHPSLKPLNAKFNFAKKIIAEIPNPAMGLIFYTLLYYLGRHWDCNMSRKYSSFLIYLSLVSSAYLTYIMFITLKLLCIICLSIHAVNIGLMYCDCKRVAKQTGGQSKPTGKKGKADRKKKQ